MKTKNSIIKYLTLNIFIILLIASFIGCSGESSEMRGVDGGNSDKQQKSLTIEGNPILSVERNVQDSENTDSYYFDLIGEYKINVVSGGKVLKSYLSLKDAKENGVSLEGVETEIVLTPDEVNAKKKALVFVSDEATKKVVECPIEILEPKLEDIEGNPTPKLFVSKDTNGKYTFTTLGGGFQIRLAYFFQPSYTFNSWQEASKFGFSINELDGEEIKISSEEESSKKKDLTLSYGDIEKVITCSLEIKDPPTITSFTVTKQPVVHVKSLPDYSGMPNTLVVNDCALESFEITPVWSDPEFVCAINTLELADKYKFTFSDGVNGSITLTKDNVKNKTVNLTITCNGKSVTTSCTIKADTEPERMLSFRVLTTPTIRFTSIPSYNVSTSYIKQGSLVCEATFDKEPYTRQFTVGSTDATNAGFTLPSVLSSSTIAITAAEHSSYGKTVTVSNGRWGLSQTAKLPISIDRASITCYYKGETKTAQVEKGTTLTQTQFLSKFGYDTVPTWYADADGKTKISFPYTVSSNVVLYGLVAYTVDFVNYSGAKIAESQTVFAGGTIVNPNITGSNYTWYVGDTVVSNILTYPINANTTFKARATYNVTFKYGAEVRTSKYLEGSVINSSDLTYKTVPNYGTTSSPTACNYYYDNIMTQKVTFPITVSKDTSLFADKYNYAGYTRKYVSNVTELKAALNNLATNTMIIMNAGTYDTAGTFGAGTGKLPSKWANARSWANTLPLCIPVNNVAIVANGNVFLKDSVTASSSQGFIGIIGNNVVLEGLSIQAYPGGKCVEVVAEGGTVISGCAIAQDIYVAELKNAADSSIPDVKDIKVSGCYIGRYLTITNGTSGNIVIENNTFGESGKLNFVGLRGTGWNNFPIDLSKIVLKNNSFSIGSKLIFKDTQLTNLNAMIGYVNPSSLGFLGTAESTTEKSNGVVTQVRTYTYGDLGGSGSGIGGGGFEIIKPGDPIPLYPPIEDTHDVKPGES